MGNVSVKQQFEKRREDLRFVTGKGQYTGDLRPEGLAYLAFVRSPYAHADIESINIDEARSARGVLAVFTASDLYKAGLRDEAGGIAYARPDGGKFPNHGRPTLASSRVRHIGEAVAAVVAETLNAALDAAEMVVVDYSPLPTVNSDNAKSQDGPAVWTDVPDNIGFQWECGDNMGVEAALCSAAHVTKAAVDISRVAVNSMEPRNVLVIPNAEELIVHVGHQAPFSLCAALTRAGFGASDVTVRVGDVGGSFGLKWGYMLEAVVVAQAARSLGRPILWESTRGEAFLTDDHAREMVATAEIGFDSNNKMVGMRVAIDQELGAYVTPKSGASVLNMNGFVGVYDVPVAHVSLTGWVTNTNTLAAYRGAGRPEATYFVEHALDVAARELGISPFEIRRRNLIPTSKMPYQTALTFEYDCGEFEQTLAKAERMAGCSSFLERRAESESRGKLRGLGLSISIEIAGGPAGNCAPEIAKVSLLSDGQIMVQPGVMSVGQGFESVFSQLVADRFGIPENLVQYNQGDTSVLPFGHGNGGSSGMCVGGSAVFQAAEDLLVQLIGIAADILEISQSEISYSAGIFRSQGNEALTLQELAESSGGVTSEVIFKPERGTFPNGTHICEVEIDPSTGAVKILDYVGVEDIGTVVNPMLADGQLHGGIVQGIGQALGEQVIYDEEGQLLTGSFMDYRMPRADDVPSFRLEFHPVPTKANPTGAKGVGEAGTVGALSATMNAINDALASGGAAPINMPATPAKLWRALKNR